MAFGPSGSGARKGAMWADNAVRTGMNLANERLGQGYQEAAGLLQQGRGLYQPYYDTGTTANQDYASGIGQNGTAARQEFDQGFNNSYYGNAGEQYGIQRQQRQAAQMGGLASGRAQAEMADYLARNRADNYSKYLGLRTPLMSQGLAAASGMNSNFANQAGLGMQNAQQQAQITNQGYNSIGQIGGNALAASDQTRQQMTNLGMQGLQMGINGIAALGGMGGITSGLSGLGSLFGGMNTMGAGAGPILPQTYLPNSGLPMGY